MIPTIITSVRDILDGAAEDVFYALHTRGSLESGQLPSKVGMTTLICLGLAITDSTQDKPHSLSTVGRIMAQEYYSALVRTAEEVAGAAHFTMRQLRPLVEHNIVRWESTRIKSEDFLQTVPDNQLFHKFNTTNGIVYECHSYRSAETEGVASIKIDLTVGDNRVDILVHPRSL